MTTSACVLSLAGLLIGSVTGFAADSELSSDSEIRALLPARLAPSSDDIGIVAGVIDKNGQRVISSGRLADGRAFDEHTLFEIGSVSKVFTGSLLAEMVQRGDVNLDDSITKYLPDSTRAPSLDGKHITLLDLATQRSGLPRLPDNLLLSDEANPYADYTPEKLYQFLSDYTLTRAPGKSYEYSNLGMGLLGQLLARRLDTNYAGLLEQRLCGPLGMTETVVELTLGLKMRLAPPHDQSGTIVKNWDLNVLAGAGGIRSSVHDMLIFLTANLSDRTSGIYAALKTAQKPVSSTDTPDTRIGLAWHVTDRDRMRIIWHNGQTGGYHSFVGLDPEKKTGVVLLCNVAQSIDDIGFHLLDSNRPLQKPKPQAQRMAIHLPAEVLDRYVGKYELAPGVFFNLRRDQQHLMAQLTGQSDFELFPESETNFFYKVVDAQLSFNLDDSRKVQSLVLHQNGMDQIAKKISDESPKERQPIKVDPKILQAYVGEYELVPGAVFTVRQSGDQLSLRLTGQSFLEVFPENETNFFYRVVDAQISFVRDEQGKTKALVLHQNGLDQTAKKTK